MCIHIFCGVWIETDRCCKHALPKGHDLIYAWTMVKPVSVTFSLGRRDARNDWEGVVFSYPRKRDAVSRIYYLIRQIFYVSLIDTRFQAIICKKTNKLTGGGWRSQLREQKRSPDYYLPEEELVTVCT